MLIIQISKPWICRCTPESGNETKQDSHVHTITDQDILEKYSDSLVMHGRMPDAFADAMGNHMYTAVFDDFSDVLEFGNYILEGKVPDFVTHYATILGKKVC